MFKGLATGIGSLPHKEAQAALDLVFKCCPQVPFWPQLPQRDRREGMLLQFSENLPCLKLAPEGLAFSPIGPERELEVFYERVIAGDIDYFRISREYACGLYAFCERLKKDGLGQARFLKGHVTGPFTFAAGINDEKGNALLHDPVFFQAISKGLLMKAFFQLRLLKEFSRNVVIFIDEPYLSCLGSGYAAVTREQVIAVLREVASGIKAQGGLVGVHCCGNTDWSVFMETEAVGIINFDAFDYADRLALYPDELRGFLERGGLLCWGIVPTQLFSGKETPDLLIRRIKETVAKLSAKGVEEDLLWQAMLISPACGTGTFTPERAEKIFSLLAETSQYLRRYG
jgi:hypothetical protein